MPREKTVGGRCTAEPDCPNMAKYSNGWCRTHYHRWWRTGTTGLIAKELRTDVGYYAAHNRCKALWGSASQYPCIECGKSSDDWAYDGTDPTEKTETLRSGSEVTYSQYPEFYMPMCKGCHAWRDKPAMAAKRTHCGNGHEWTAENVYERPSRPGKRECRQCKVENSAQRYLKRKLAKEFS